MESDRYLAWLIRAGKNQQDSIMVLTGSDDQFTRYLLALEGIRLTENEYLKILQLFYERYILEERKKDCDREEAKRFCILQINRLKACRKKSYLYKFYPFLDYSEESNGEIEEFIESLPDYYHEMEENLTKKAIVLCSLVAWGLLFFCVLLWKMAFFPVVLLLIGLSVIFFYFFRSMILPKICDDRLRAMRVNLGDLQQRLESRMPRF